MGYSSTSSLPTVLELFVGVGGLSLGFHRAGYRIVGSVEIDHINVASYKRNFPEVPVLEDDVSKIDGEQLANQFGSVVQNLDVLVGGPPCQGFSSIGRRNENDPRNNLFRDMARLIEQVRPKYFVVENVSGLLKGYGTHLLNRFIEATKNSGYTVVTPVQVLQAYQFGVPQNRERVFVLGYRDDVRNLRYPQPRDISLTTVWEAIGDLPNVDEIPELSTSDVYFGPLGSPSEYVKKLRDRKVEGLTGCSQTKHTSATRTRFLATRPGTTEPISRFFRLSADGLANTLRAGTDKSNGSHTAPRPIHPVYPRCITVREAARLQSFPDWFQFHDTKWHSLRQIGNAVPPLMAEAVASHLLSYL